MVLYLEAAALAIAADMVAGLHGFEQGGAYVVGGVDDEYFFHGAAFLGDLYGEAQNVEVPVKMMSNGKLRALV